MQNKKVLSFGELLLRICLDDYWLTDNRFPFYVGGAEVNVASALALWNIPSAYMTALPDNDMSRELLSYLNNLGIDTTRTPLVGDRIGLYYLAKGKDLKNSGVIYDRANSSFANLDRKGIDWDKVFEDVSWLHLSAICPALTQSMADICLDAVKIAHQKGIFVSLDLNYRSKLWKYGKTPIDIIPEIASFCQLIMGNVWAAHQMLGISIDKELLTTQQYSHDLLLSQAENTSKEIIKRYPSCIAVANTFRFDQEKGLRYFTTLFEQQKLIVSNIWEKENIVDKVGSGDCFMAGLIYGFYKKLDISDTLNFATAAAVAKLDIPSDATTSTFSDIMTLLNNY